MNFREQWKGLFPVLTLAADVRFCQPDYTNDIIWEMSLTNGEPVAVALQTTLGLRARSLRLFPIFSPGQSNFKRSKNLCLTSNPCKRSILITCHSIFRRLKELRFWENTGYPIPKSLPGDFLSPTQGNNPKQLVLTCQPSSILWAKGWQWR